MKKILIFCVLGIFFILIAIYLVQSSTPYNLDKLQEIIIGNDIKPGDWVALNAEIQNLVKRGLILDYLSNSAYLAFSSVLMGLGSFFVAIHLSVDKLFFKNFFEQPSLFNALRRALLVCIGVTLIAYMKLSAIELQIIILVPIAILILEILFVSYLKTKFTQIFGKKEKNVNDKEKISDVRTL